MAIAFFDLDLTLLAVNSATLWVRSERKLGHLTAGQALRAGGWLVAYRLGLASMHDSLLKAIASLKGVPESEIRQRSRAFYETQVRPVFRPGGKQALEEHRQRGDRRVLLTSSSNYLSELVAADLSLDDFLCNRFEVDSAGLYTGQPAGPLCYGAGKLTAAEAYAESRGIRLQACSFYTDSITDAPVLEAVGYPRVVNPDRRLRRLAARRGWQVLDWGASG